MQVAWSVIETPAHEGSKAYRRMTAEQAQHKVVAVGSRAAKRRFTTHKEDELCNIL